MLIRSQDKKRIINLGNIDLIDANCVNEIITFSGGLDTECLIANYSTEEKAIKVLDMIQEAYARCESVKALSSGIMFEVTERIGTQEKAEDFKKEHRSAFVFQMPQDSEV